MAKLQTKSSLDAKEILRLKQSLKDAKKKLADREEAHVSAEHALNETIKHLQDSHARTELQYQADRDRWAATASAEPLRSPTGAESGEEEEHLQVFMTSMKNSNYNCKKSM